jgi:hypothetical protein
MKNEVIRLRRNFGAAHKTLIVDCWMLITERTYFVKKKGDRIQKSRKNKIGSGGFGSVFKIGFSMKTVRVTKYY